MPITRAYAQAAEPGNFFVAGKNKIINGDFAINQRAFTTTTTDSIFTFDRFRTRITGDGTATYSAQIFTPGSAPVSGYESTNYMQIVTASQTTSAVRTILRTYFEDVRTFAGQTVTFSFWAKAASGTPKVAPFFSQNFGSGGSAGVDTPTSAITISTSWARYSTTVSIPSVSGKTIGSGSYVLVDLAVSAGSDFNTQYSSIGIQNNTFSIWGVQVEAGSVATPFQTATGTLAGELAACQRYYWRQTGEVYTPYGIGLSYAATTSNILVNFPVTMRVVPTSLDFSNVQITDLQNYGLTISALTLNSGGTGKQIARLDATHSTGATLYRTAFMRNDNNSAGYIGFSAEL